MLNENCISAILQEIKIQRLPESFSQIVENEYYTVTKDIHERIDRSRPFMVSINGAQGSGKSTLTTFLKLILEHQYQYAVETVSIDDFYLSQTERTRLSKKIHPLLRTRGVPGTHDLPLARETLQCLLESSPGTVCKIPRFDKSTDNPLPKEKWTIVNRVVDVIFFEGWCNHAPMESESALATPVNELEIEEDSEGVWRNYVNNQLAKYHKELFDLADMLILMKVPDFNKVIEWRGLQEVKLREASSGNPKGIMDELQLRRFIQHYERITRHCLKVLPEEADIVIHLNESHAIDSLVLR